MTDTIQQQAESFGAEFHLAEVTGFELELDIKAVHTSREDYRCFGILLATGTHPRTVGFKGEDEHKGRGVAYCATCDGEFFTGKEVFIIGGGYAAAVLVVSKSFSYAQNKLSERSEEPLLKSIEQRRSSLDNEQKDSISSSATNVPQW